MEDTFISKHDVYGDNVLDGWNELQSAGQVETQAIEVDADEELIVVKSE